MNHYIFGYGSLVNQEVLHRYLGRRCVVGEARLCQLKEFRRCWNVAMDNQVDLPGYKYYVDAETGERPAIFVTFLNIRYAKHSVITGMLFQVSQEELHFLDLRERNYQRIEVTDYLNTSVRESKVWAYIGTEEAEKRYQQGLTTGTAYIPEAYYHFVGECFYCYGEAAAQAYMHAMDPPEVPLRKLNRIDITI